MQEIKERAKELLASGQVQRVLGWKRGEDLPYNPQPAFFENEAQLEELVYDSFCAANLSKYMIQASKLEGKTLVFLKPCDTYSFNQLLKERRVDREKSYIIGVGCKGKLDIEKIKKLGIKGIESVEEEGDTLHTKQSTARRPVLLQMVSWSAACVARETSIKYMMNSFMKS